MIREFFAGVNAYFKAYRVIKRHNMWRYFLAPGFMSLFYVLALIITGWVYVDDFSAHVMAEWIPGFLKGGVTAFFTAFLLWIVLLLTGYMTYKHAVLILFSPILGYLSEVTEKAVYHEAGPDFDVRQLLKDILRGLVINLRNIAFTLALSLMAWLIVFIPIIGAVISPVLLFLIQFYYNGFGLADYTLERKRYSVRESVRFVSDHRPRIIGVGMVFMLIIFVPVLGWFTAPTLGTVAATLAVLEKINADDKALQEL